MPRTRIRRIVRKALLENVGLKIVAFGAALVLFSLVRGSADAQRSMFIDLVAILPPASAGKVLVSDLPDKVRLTVRGSRSVLSAVGRTKLDPVHIDLRDTKRRYYYFDPAEFGLPHGVEILQIAPASLALKWADRAERRLMVAPRLFGEPAEGFVARGITDVNPQQVLVRGPAPELQKIRKLTTEPVDVRGLTGGRHIQSVQLDPPPDHLLYINPPREVRVTVEIVPEQEATPQIESQ